MSDTDRHEGPVCRVRTHDRHGSCRLIHREQHPPRRKETPEFAAAARRFMMAYGRRVGGGDIEDLGEFQETLRVYADLAMDEAVAGLRAQGHSFGDIARGLGIDRRSAYDRFAGRGARRREQRYEAAGIARG